MKNSINKIWKKLTATILVASFFLTACNKGFEDVPATATPASGLTIAEIINTNPSYSILREGLLRAGLMNQLAVQGANITLYAPDNDAFIASGISAAVIPLVPLTTLVPLLQYHIVETKLPGASIPASFPNLQMPSLLQLPGGNPLVRMNIFPAKNGTSFYVNNLPITQIDAINASNGIMHKVPFIVQPPSSVLAQQIYTDPQYSYLTAAIQRADSGQINLNRFDSILKFGVANVTVFAPNNTAFQNLLIPTITQALIAQGVPPATALATATTLASTPAVFSNPALFSALSAQTVRGIVAYHIITSRAFSVNLPLTTGFIKTALNGAIPAHPGVTVDRTNPSPRLLGLGNGAGNFANFTSVDFNAVNGIWHKIDRVLLPQ
jgi:uncharacterized surface protein with fasciclin (FAS1) repeats